MTNVADQLSQGTAYYARYAQWNATSALSGMPTASSPYDAQNLGIPHTQTIVYQVGTASTALASGVFFSASGATAAGTLTSTGPLVSGGVATFDVPRCVRFTASVDLSTNVFTIRGTDGYGATQSWSGAGPTGNTFGNNGSFVDSTVAFKTITTASAVGASSTTMFTIGSSNTFGLPFRIANTGKGLDIYINGNSATVPGTWTAGFTASGTPTASTADVRGTFAPATTSLPDGVKFYTVQFVAPTVGLAAGIDNKEQSYGAAPFSST